MFNFLQIFQSKDKSIESPKEFHNKILELKKLQRPTPLSDEFEGLPISDEERFKKVWYEDQGEHWEGWVSNHFGLIGFIFRIIPPNGYERGSRKRTSEFIYNHIMCPPMLTWLAESVGVDNDLLKEAIAEASKSNQYQKQCAVLRKYIGWSEIKRLIYN